MALTPKPTLLSRLPASLRIPQTRTISTDHLPRVVQPSIWHSIVPKALRKSSKPPSPPGTTPSLGPSKFRTFLANPVTPIFLLALCIGSQAIQLLTLRAEMLAQTRKTDAKIAGLREVIRRVQAGEDVDVARELGTGDRKREREWRDVVAEIEDEEAWWRHIEERRERERVARAGRRGEGVKKEEEERVKIEEKEEQSGEARTERRKPLFV